MKPQLVFVHGIGPLRHTEQEAKTWTEAICRGFQAAGHSDMAMRPDHSFVPTFVNYADLFLSPDAQGFQNPVTSPPEPPVLEDLRTLALEILQWNLANEANETERQALSGAISSLNPELPHQGGPDIVRRLLNAFTTIVNIRGVRRGAQWATGTKLFGHASQLCRYLERTPDSDGYTLDRRIRQRVHDVLSRAPSIVVAHSLGSIVAHEALHECSTTVPLFVTLGSPLALRSLVYPRILNQPPQVPECVTRWLNFWDRDDIIPARPILERDFLPNSRGVRPDTRRVDSDGLRVHAATKYLLQAAVAGPVAEALSLLERQGIRELPQSIREAPHP